MKIRWGLKNTTSRQHKHHCRRCMANIEHSQLILNLLRVIFTTLKTVLDLHHQSGLQIYLRVLEQHLNLQTLRYEMRPPHG